MHSLQKIENSLIFLFNSLLCFSRVSQWHWLTLSHLSDFLYFLAVTKSLFPSPSGGIQSFPEFPVREEHAVQNWSWLFPLWESRQSLRKFTGLEGQPLSNIWGSFPWNVGNSSFFLQSISLQKEITLSFPPLPFGLLDRLIILFLVDATHIVHSLPAVTNPTVL